MTPKSDSESSKSSNSRVLGDFRLLKILGSGGGGVVWEAEEIALGRKVALKLFPPSSTELELAAFFRESTASGRLNHPSIVQIFSSGVIDGQPYLAQELISGGDLSTWISTVRDGVNLQGRYYTACAKLMLQIAEGLAIAHEAGIVHCDLKPSNILLTDDAVPKVSDFGLAMIGDQFPEDLQPGVGSPYTMSPEQVAAERLSLGPLTDVFSLGATFYEILTLQRAFDGDTLQQVVEKILLENPIPPDCIHSRIPKDLSAICLKALEKRPADRYESMRAFADDIKRFLQHKSVRAKSPSLIGLLRRWVRRRPLPATALFMGIGASFLIGLMALDNLSNRKTMETAEGLARLAQNRAVSESDIAVTSLRFLQNVFAGSDEGSPAHNLLLKSEELIYADLSAQPSIQARLLQTLGRVHSSIGDYDSAEPLLSQSYALNVEVFGKGSVPAIRSEISSARLAILRGNYSVAEDRLQVAFSQLSPDAELSLELRHLLGHVRWRMGKSGQSRVLAEVLQEQRLRFGELDVRTLETQNSLLEIYFDEKRFSEAEPLALLEYQARKSRDSPNHPDVLTSLHDLASVYAAQGRYAEAESRYLEVLGGRRRIFPKGHPDILRTLGNLAVLYRELERFDEAEEMSRQVFEYRKLALPQNHPNILVAASNLATVLRKKGSLDEAEELYRFVLNGLQSRGETESVLALVTREGFVRLLISREKWRDAESEATLLLDATAADSPFLSRRRDLLADIQKRRF